MKKQLLILLPALLLLILLSSCLMFVPTPEITNFEASATTINAGDSVTFTVKGSTKDPMAYSDLVDYSGTILITSSPAGISEELTFDDSAATGFELTKTITFDTIGTYSLTATLTSSGLSVIDNSVTIIVEDSKPWSEADSLEPYTITSEQTWISGYSISPSSDIDWFKFQTSSSSSSYYIIHWQDSLDYLSDDYTADVQVSVYNADGDLLEGPLDSGCWESDGSYASYGSTDGIRISVSDNDYNESEYIYIKVEGFYSTTTGTFSLYIY